MRRDPTAPPTSQLLVATYGYAAQSDLIAQLDRDTGGQPLQTVVSYEAQRNLISQVLNQTPGQGGANVIARYEYGNDAGGRRTEPPAHLVSCSE